MRSAMNLQIRIRNMTIGGCGLLSACLLGLLAGCGSDGQAPDRVAQQEEEIRRLQQENELLPQARAENEEVQRLRRENQELPKLRSQYQEMTRLQQENQQLAQQLARVRPRADGPGSTPAGAAGDVAVPAGAFPPPPAPPDGGGGEGEGEVMDESLMLGEGDEILVAPMEMEQILPGFDWESLDRQEPIGVRALLERDGVQLTNMLQLKEYGLTNFMIRRAQPVPVTEPPQVPQN
jgi:hypothetical protein